MHILEANRSRDGLVIVFADGKTGLYPPDVLYALLPSLDHVIDGPEDPDQ